MNRSAGALLAVFASAAAADERGWSLQGLPLVSYSTDEGLGYGVRLQLVDHADVQPYRYAITAQFYQTTKMVAAHAVSFDAPGFLGTRNRFDGELAWAIYKFFPYYGLGNSSVYRPRFVDCPDRASLAADPDRCAGNPDFRGLRYYQYGQQTLPRVRLNLRRDLAGPWKLFAGYRFRLTQISPLYGADDLGQHGPSRFVLDAQAGRLVGWDGANPAQSFRRRTAEVTAGLVYDSRDNEPQPTEGIFGEASLRSGLKLAGSAFDYQGANATLRLYHWIGFRSLVVAFRVLFDAAGGDVPFFLLNTTGGLAGPDAVGGDSSVRGLLADRFQGKVKLLANSELRWKFWSTTHLDFSAVTALDAGRVWSALGDSDPGPMRWGGAAGLRIAWNKTFVVRFDYGLGISEPFANGNVYLTFDEAF